jgi:hypothetical protein
MPLFLVEINFCFCFEDPYEQLESIRFKIIARQNAFAQRIHNPVAIAKRRGNCAPPRPIQSNGTSQLSQSCLVFNYLHEKKGSESYK